MNLKIRQQVVAYNFSFHNILENPQISNMNSDFVPASTVSQQREAIPYICGLGARFGHERV